MVNLREDADTTGAIYGQIAGAFYGVESIPSEWRRRLAMGAESEFLADSLFEGGTQFIMQKCAGGLQRRKLPVCWSPCRVVCRFLHICARF